MKYKLVAIGKIKQNYLRDAVAEYEKRLRRYGSIKIIEVPERKSSERPEGTDLRQRLEAEGDALLRHVRDNDYLILLDIQGKTMTSEEFAAHLRELGIRGYGEVTLAIGGAFGVGENIRRRAQLRLSLGSWTYTHQMVRYLVLEGLYRAEKINHGEPYHW